ncbi:Flp pilus assembly protein CpaB [Streptosporangium becharense]|uniref:Flp pilus assembly protein CpaB n=1 Tax=Streptosporangium becharense TaxID=1816182 RepID=A0A7W9IID4_9ACTN|nr:Flp pilus assembly protein CpaB [Streptosporangium becharense]MBB2915480.1 Flp pilus assembly protein CpaB [Streptosporangium becharense]MBB5820985.1 Flp pilus assembly protein CpaB [Streptosporangium becharense]
MRALRRLLSRRHRLIAAAFAALAAGCALLALSPDTASVTVLAAARDLPGGVLDAADLAPVDLRPGTVPDGALKPGAQVTGRILVGPMRRGEPLTDVRLLGPSLLAAHNPGTVAAPVRVADPETARLISPGDIVDVLAAPTTWDGSVPARIVAQDVTVLATPEGESERGALVVLAMTSAQATELASAQAGGRLSITIGPRRR